VTLADAIEEAMQHNLALLAEKSNLSIAEASMITARTRPNPVISLGADQLDLLGTGFDSSNNGGPPEMAVRVDLPIERGGKRERRIELASFEKSLAEAQLADSIRSLRLDVTLACIDVLAARATRALLADNLRAFESLADINRARVVAGAIAPFESTRSEVAKLQFRSTVVRADLDLETATARLRALLGREPGTALEVAGDLSAFGKSVTPDLGSWQQLALASRPDLHALQLTEARTVADLRLQEAVGKIDYTVGAEYRRQQGIAGRSNSLGFFVSAPLPVFDRNQGAIARADAGREQVARQIAARRAQILSDVQTAYNEYVTSRGLVADIERDLIAPATSARDISAYTYRVGGSSLLELLDAERAFNDTMQSYLDAQTSLRRAGTRLNAAVGLEVVK
jgi:cobalt-zinc-cadmium efflux system outer membrane protein